MRVMGSDAIGQQEKDVLQVQYQELDPVDLFSQIEAHQDLFWRYAYTTPQSIDSASNAIPSKTSWHDATQDRINDKRESASPLNRSERMFRRTKKPGRYHLVQHTWRTRPDPFELVNDWIDEELTRHPHVEAKSLLRILQAQYPGRFQDGQLRTLQRRVKDWRLKQLIRMTEEIGLVMSSENEGNLYAPR